MPARQRPVAPVVAVGEMGALCLATADFELTVTVLPERVPDDFWAGHVAG